jgi:hypothetical protein
MLIIRELGLEADQQRFGNTSRLTPKLLAAPPEPPGPLSLTIVHVSQKRGGKYR